MKKSKIAKKYGVTKKILKNNEFCVIDETYPLTLDVADRSVGAAHDDMYILIVRDENELDIPPHYFAKYNGVAVAAGLDCYYFHPIKTYAMPAELIESNENSTSLIYDIKNLISKTKDTDLNNITMKDYDNLIKTARNLIDAIKTKK